MGIFAYLFSKESIKEYRKILPFAIMAMLFTIFTGTYYGANFRKANGEYEKEYEKRKLLFEKSDIETIKLYLQKRVESDSLNIMSKDSLLHLLNDFDTYYMKETSR